MSNLPARPEDLIGRTVMARRPGHVRRLRLVVDKVVLDEDGDAMLLGHIPYTDARYAGSARGYGWAYLSGVDEVLP